jgi:cytochrome P450
MATSPVDLSSISFWAQTPEARDAAFAVLRAEDPVAWQRPPESPLMPDGETGAGYWAISRYEDVRAISRDNKRFCSSQGVMLEDVPSELTEAAHSFLAMDAPRHTQVRGLVQKAFGPRRVRLLEDRVRELASGIVDDVAPLGECDFVERVAKRLPLLLFRDMVGVSEADEDRVIEAADLMVSWNDPDVLGDRQPVELLFEALMALTGAALEMADDRATNPRDDLMTALVQAEIDGQRLAPEEISAFFVLLSVAGNDTTRHATSHTLRALTVHPDQRAVLAEDLDGRIETAVEEFVRWATPVMTFRRTATEDVKLRGRTIVAGDKVALLYSSANRDEDGFAQPERFDVLREPNQHVGFGGGGIHYCLGASLARTMLRSITTELLTRLPDIEAGEPEPLVGNFINGIKRMPCRFTPA